MSKVAIKKQSTPSEDTRSKSGIYTVIGIDTYIGAHMLKHLREKNQFVYGHSQEEDVTLDFKEIPVDEISKLPEDVPSVQSHWLVICIDPSIGFEKYTTKIKKLFDDLENQEFTGDICLFSSATICMPNLDKPISENTVVYSRNKHDLALATGENLLTVLGCSEKGYIVPHIMRLGIPYGDEIGMKNLPYFVNHMINDAENKSSLMIPIGGDAKRSLTHISDICEAAMALMNSDYCPALVNIPGEVKTITEVGSAISNKYHVDFMERGLNMHDNPDYFAGDQHLSDEYFNENVVFTRKYTFEQWLEELPPK